MTLVADSQSGQARQLPLFETEPSSPQLDNGGLAFSDPAFAGNKTLPIHRWVPWIAGFSGDFVRGALNKYLDDEGTVLDPFSGVGTTLVEAVLLGHSAIGFEINPYAALACRVKTSAHRINVERLNDEILKLRQFYVGNSIIQSNVRVAKAKDSHQLYEAVVELKKR